MGRQAYKNISFRPETERLIDVMNGIIDEYVSQGYRLTVRQLYYQLVARDYVENTERSYKRITSIVNDAKLAGVMDWEAIEDRTREFIRRARWNSASEIIHTAANGFHMDMWEDQKYRVFVIVEKEALAGVLERSCRDFDAPLLAARGYPSGTVLREFTESDILPCMENQTPVILHLGDHDPSGIDMSRDLTDRFGMFVSGEYDGVSSQEFIRIALNMDQIQTQKPPPNPAKATDARFESYRKQYGTESWELDALKPEYLDRLVRKHIKKFIDNGTWNERAQYIEGVRAKIKEVANNFDKQ
jgi:hypothetical protein